MINPKEAPLAEPAIASTFTALADPTRRGVVEILRKGPQSAGELAHACSTSAPAMSRHLRVLRRSGLIAEERGEEDGRLRIYRLRRAPFDELSDWLRDVERFWSEQLGSFKAHAESTRRRKRR